MSGNGLRVSVVVPTYERRESLRRLLHALTAQTLPHADFEVVVSIDGSRDGTLEMLAALGAPYALRGVWGPNRGRAGACNRGIAHAAGELVVLLDDDMEPEPACLAAHVAHHAGRARLGVLGAVPIVVASGGPASQRYVAAKFAAHLDRLAAGAAIGPRDFYSGHFSIRRQLMLSLGGFDETFTLYGNEDVELALRVAAAGIELVYCPEARALQHYEKDFGALARDTIAKGRTAWLCAKKHPEALAQLRLGTYGQGSPQWRLVRAALLRLTTWRPGVADAIITLGRRLERRTAFGHERFFRLALDYLFWVGARSAMRESPDAKVREALSGAA